MLSPEQIDAAGDAVAVIYNDIETQMLDLLVDKLLSGEALEQRSLTALALLSQTHGQELTQIITKNKGAIDAAAREAVTRAITASDNDDMHRAGGGAPLYPQQIAQTITGVAEILARDNLQMVEGAKKAFLDASTEAITRVNAGVMTTERALHSAVRKLERDGIPIITYQNRQTKMVTVQNKVDVAVRRHVRTQIAQDGARMTMERLEKMDVDLVEVSSHAGARPSHAAWQGRCYSLRGDVVIDGTKYPDFYSATRYGSVDGLLGANCRHSFGPYRHGMPRAYEPDPKHPSGLSGDEIYDLEQGQRALERRIRADKRELRGAQKAYDALGTLEAKSELIKAQQRLKDSQKAIRTYIDDANARSKDPTVKVLHRKPNREWAGDMPKAKQVTGSGRKLDDFLGGSGVASTLKANGISKTAARKAMADEMAKRGGTASDFAALSAGEQQTMLRSVIAGLGKKLGGAAKAEKGAHVDTLAGVTRGKPMSFDKANGGRVNPNYELGGKYWLNCQSCVVAFEARLRGYDVIARPYSKHSVMADLAAYENVAWIDPETGARPPIIYGDGANTPKRVLKFLDDNVEQGARYTISYATDSLGNGHIQTIFRKDDGELRIYDPQTGKILDGAAVREHIKTFVLRATVNGLKVEHPVGLLRVDNMEINKTIVEQIVEEAR